MSKRLNEREPAVKTAFKLVPCAIGHDRRQWAICGNCKLRVRVINALRWAEKRGYKKGLKVGYAFGATGVAKRED